MFQTESPKSAKVIDYIQFLGIDIQGIKYHINLSPLHNSMSYVVCFMTRPIILYVICSIIALTIVYIQQLN